MPGCAAGRPIAMGMNTLVKAPSPRMCPGWTSAGREGTPASEYSCGSCVISILFTVRLQVPLFETGKRFCDKQGPTLWITVGEKA